jgi:RNA polymerase sigma-70 factor (ECF subfamily)
MIATNADREEATVKLPPDDDVIAALRAGDEATFATLLDTWSQGMLRVARAYVSTPEIAEEVVQDTWLAVLGAIGGFEGRSSLKTWIFRILVNTARKLGARESRTVPWSSVFVPEQAAGEPPVARREAPGRDGGPVADAPEGEVLASEAREQIWLALAGLPLRQRSVLVLRDLEGCTAEEVCEILEISPANQRVLLHRARMAVRRRLAGYFEAVRPSA